MAIYNQYHYEYRRLYPAITISPEVMSVLRKSDRKMEYMEVDLKRERFRQDQKKQIAEFIPSREDSYERICEEGKLEFTSPVKQPEEIAIHKDEIQRLNNALKQLSSAELDLVEALFFKGMTEREYARQIGITQGGVDKRWRKVREKLKKIMRE